jgi:malate permease and related proteins
MSNFVIILVCLIAGSVIRRCGKFERRDAKPLNTVVLWLALPALIFVEVPKLFRDLELSPEILWTAGMPWIQFGIAFLLALFLRRVTGMSLKLAGAFTLAAGLANTSFVGFPLIEAFYGNEGLRYGIFADQLGSFLALSTVGLFVASGCAGRRLSVSTIVRRVAFFPPFISFCLAIVWGLSSIPVEGFVIDGLRRLGGLVVPLSLLAVGWQLELSSTAILRYRIPLLVGLGYKLVVFPLLFALVLRSFVDPSQLMYKVTVIEAAMGPMITAAVVATEFELEPEFSQLMVGIGIPLSFLTLAIWHWVL